jgi:hypothetical protein
MAGKVGYRPQLVVGTTEKQCVASKQEIRASHMSLLDQWRDDFVRLDRQFHVAPSGKVYRKSLTGTCLGCHTDRTKFCDQCHDYVGVEPYCWDCHNTPPTRSGGGKLAAR